MASRAKALLVFLPVASAEEYRAAGVLWDRSTDFTCMGDDLSTANADNLDTCARSCLDNKNCISFEFPSNHYAAGKCTLQGRGSEKSEILGQGCATGWSTAGNEHFTSLQSFRNPHSHAPPGLQYNYAKTWAVVEQFDCFEDVAMGHATISPGSKFEMHEQCAKHCVELKSCEAFSYPRDANHVHEEKTCYLHGRNDGIIVNKTDGSVDCNGGIYTQKWNLHVLAREPTSITHSTTVVYPPGGYERHARFYPYFDDVTVENDPWACKAKCGQVDDCVHWSFDERTNKCYLSGQAAILQQGWVFWVSGWKTQDYNPVAQASCQGGAKCEYMGNKLDCLRQHNKYAPAFPVRLDHDEVMSAADPARFVIATCQAKCAMAHGCSNFYLEGDFNNMANVRCYLADPESKLVLGGAADMSIAGPATCAPFVKTAKKDHKTPPLPHAEAPYVRLFQSTKVSNALPSFAAMCAGLAGVVTAVAGFFTAYRVWSHRRSMSSQMRLVETSVDVESINHVEGTNE